jgi:hypothetical protein
MRQVHTHDKSLGDALAGCFYGRNTPCGASRTAVSNDTISRKIRAVGTELFHADWRADIHDRHFTNAPKNADGIQDAD